MARMGSSLTGASSLPEEFLSVRDIVHRRMGVDADPWHLALVQRDEVWGDVRMRSLLDSLLAHYPIGSLLLCSVEQPTQAISVDGLRSLVTDEADIPQLPGLN